MIRLQRKLLIILRSRIVEDGKAPAAMKPNTYYPVVGYSVQYVKRTSKPNESGQSTEREYEEMTGYYFINQKSDLAFVYSSYVDVSLDPLCEAITQTELIKGAAGNGEKTSG